MSATHRLEISGNTKPHKATLKRRGWQWDSATQSWFMLLVPAHADRVRAIDKEFVKGLCGGIAPSACRIWLDGKAIMTSKGYAEYNAIPAVTMEGIYIPGSNPEDRI